MSVEIQYLTLLVKLWVSLENTGSEKIQKIIQRVELHLNNNQVINKKFKKSNITKKPCNVLGRFLVFDYAVPIAILGYTWVMGQGLDMSGASL